jgi:predicted RNA-binding protein with TRAM domain
MAVPVTIYCQSVVWNSVTYDKSSGGPLAVTYQHEGDPIEDRTGDNEYAVFVAAANKGMRVTARLRDVKQTLAIGTKAQLVATLIGKSNDAPRTLTFPGMVLMGVRGAQDRASPGDVEISLVHESTDGTTVPVS